ncbi:MAG: hypothetical protein ACLUVC_02250 [Longibaculum sp.]
MSDRIELLKKIEKLEKALDKACLKIVRMDKCHQNENDEWCDENITVKECKDCWKEWCLKDE